MDLRCRLRGNSRFWRAWRNSLLRWCSFWLTRGVAHRFYGFKRHSGLCWCGLGWGFNRGRRLLGRRDLCWLLNRSIRLDHSGWLRFGRSRLRRSSNW